MTPRETIEWFVAAGYQPVFWPAIEDSKGPTEAGWPAKNYTIADYRDGYRVGVKLGSEISPGKFGYDIDIDWAPGALIARNIFPLGGLTFGRSSKPCSHLFCTAADRLTSRRYLDIDKSMLIEFRGTTLEGTVGFQTMVPPSIWSKDGKAEPLVFVNFSPPAHFTTASELMQRVCLVAIGMILAKHLGSNGFGHEPRLAWAGYLLRAGIPPADLITMGEAMSAVCNNTEIADVRRVVESTDKSLAKGQLQKVKGGPSLAALLGADGKAVIDRINEWLGRDSDYVRNSKGQIIGDHQENIRRAVRILGHELSFNEFSTKHLLDGEPFEDSQLDTLWLRIDEECRFRPTPPFFEKVTKHIARANSFHPVKDYFTTLTWDRIPRVDTWLIKSAKAKDTRYTRAVSAIMLIAAVRRVKDPGCKYDEMVILESPQGLGKSSALRALCPNGEWFSDDLQLNVTSQRLIEATLGKWIIEVAELAGKRKAEIESLKATLSRQIDGPARMAYAHLPVERPRQFILVGTTNSAAYLTDPTGSRRFWPIAVDVFNTQWIQQHRDQLWAEAVIRELAAEPIRLSEDLWPSATEAQEQRRESDSWETALRALLIPLMPQHAYQKLRIATSDLWTALGIPLERQDRSGATRISEIMQRFGFARTRMRKEMPDGSHGDPEVGYISVRSELLELGEDDDSDLAEIQ